MLISSGFMEIQIWEFLRYFSFFFCLKHRVLAPWYILPTNVFLSVPSSFLSGLLEWMLSLEHPPLLCHFLTLQFPFCSSVTLYSMIDSPQEAICGPLLWRISYKNKLYYAVWEINLMGKQLQTAALCKQVQNKIQQLLNASPLRAEISCPAIHPLPYREPRAGRKMRELHGDGGQEPKRCPVQKLMLWEWSSLTWVCGNKGKQDTFCLKEDFDISTARVFLCWEIGFEC